MDVVKGGRLTASQSVSGHDHLLGDLADVDVSGADLVPDPVLLGYTGLAWVPVSATDLGSLSVGSSGGGSTSGPTGLYRDHGAVGTAETASLDDASVHRMLLSSSSVTLDLTGAVDGEYCELKLILVQDGTGSRLVSWPGTVRWPAGVPPTLSTGAGQTDVVQLFSVDGASWFGFLLGSDMAY